MIPLQLPTILAKIFGFYRIGLRNPTTGKVMRVDVLVMEVRRLGLSKLVAHSRFPPSQNLFYQRQLTQVFDLKGSTRNRMVDAKKRAGQVLMDENLVESEHVQAQRAARCSRRYLNSVR